MRSSVLPAFWDGYRKLDISVQLQARKAYRLWSNNPFHPALRFKCVNREENLWAVRITRAYRAIAVVDEDVATWFWIGCHDDYERFFG
jgi:hypothetical protein